MHFLINPGKRGKVRRRRTRARAVSTKRRRRKSSTRRRTTLSRGSTMARRRRRRHAAIKTTHRRRRRRTVVARRRRRRSNPGALAAARHNPRRRRRVSARRRSVRRRYRRNPSLLGSSRGIVGSIIQGLKDGGAVVGGQVVARKVAGAVTGILPATMQPKVQSGFGKIALSLASAVATSIIARKVLPNQSRLISAGAFSETINCALAQTPIAPFLSAYPVRRTNPHLRAYPGTGASRLIAQAPRMSAWPRTVGVPSHAGVI